MNYVVNKRIASPLTVLVLRKVLEAVLCLVVLLVPFHLGLTCHVRPRQTVKDILIPIYVAIKSAVVV